MRLSLKYRIAIVIFLLEVCVMGLVLWKTLGHSFEVSREQFSANEQVMLDVLGGISRVALRTEEYADLQPYLENMLNDPRVVRIMLADSGGRVVAGSRPGDVGLTLPALIDRGDYFWRSREITSATGQPGVLAMEFSNAVLLKTYRKARNLGLGIAALGMAIIAIAGVFTGFLLTRRLERVTHAAQRFSQSEMAESSDGMARNVAENQRHVQDSEHYHRMLFERSPIGLALCRMNGDLVDINLAYARIMGRTIEETLELTYWDITPEKYAADEQQQLENLKNTGRYGPFEKEYIHKDGHLVPVRLQGALLEKDGETFIWSSVEDVTERRQAEQALRDSEERNKLMLDSSGEAIYGVDLDGNCTFINPACLRILGYDNEQNLLGKNMHELIHHSRLDGSPCPGQECRMYQSLSEGRGVYLEDEVLWRADGSNFSAEYWSYPVHKEGRMIGSVVAFVDITERKRSEEVLRRTQKMEAISQLSGGIAHDFNNQLGVIIGYLDFLKMHFPEDNKPRQWVETATKATLRCMDLTRQLLAFSRRKGKAKVAVDLNATLKNLENMIARSVTPAIDVQYLLGDELEMTEIDVGEFQDTILNLVINARDAMPGGGKLLIETASQYLDADYATLNPGVEPGDYVQLKLSDTGTGMDKETLEHIFEPFFTTKPEGEGSGLGLAMVYGFVQRYDGHIKVYSETGVGTVIRLYLPRSSISGSPDVVENSDVNVLPTGSETILIVDDEDDLLHLADDYLSSLGYRTCRAKNAAQALEMFAAEEEIDLLFSDVVMPGGKDGYDLAQQATELRPGLKVLLTSGYTVRNVGNKNQARFSAHLLGKPYRKDDLAKRVRLVLDETGTDDSTILVVDDEEGVRELFKLNLERLGYRIVLACNGDEAIALYRQSQESGARIDAIILDLSLPGSMDGKEVADKIRTLDPHAKIIVASGHSEGPEMTRYKDYGFQGALEKDFNRDNIKLVLGRVLTSGKQ